MSSDGRSGVRRDSRRDGEIQRVKAIGADAAAGLIELARRNAAENGVRAEVPIVVFQERFLGIAAEEFLLYGYGNSGVLLNDSGGKARFDLQRPMIAEWEPKVEGCIAYIAFPIGAQGAIRNEFESIRCAERGVLGAEGEARVEDRARVRCGRDSAGSQITRWKAALEVTTFELAAKTKHRPCLRRAGAWWQADVR